MKFKEMNLPNKLTTIRMACVPFMLLLFILFLLANKLGVECDLAIYKSEDGKNYLTLLQIIMCVIFIGASITDYVDGHLARKNHIVTDYGKLMDPLADKLLVNTTIICMLASNFYFVGQASFNYLAIIAILMSILVIARDIFVDALRMQALKKGAVVAASIWGKMKTATLMPGVVFMLLGSTSIYILAIGLTLMIFGGLFALIGGIQYYQNMKTYISE